MYSPAPDCQIKNLAELYESFWGDLRDGTFLEIGAFDGSSVSNTCFLADRGWKGFYFEPIPEYALQCLMRHMHNDVKVFPCAVGEHNTMIDISVGIMISSIRKDHVSLFNQMDWSKNHHNGDIRRVPCLDINTVLAQLSLPKCNLAVIDVEGYEPIITGKWNFDILRPEILIVETRDQDSNFPKDIRNEYKAMIRRLTSNGYKIIQHDGFNVILSCIHSKHDNSSLIVF